MIAMTGWGQAQDQAEALAAGFDHHLTKPADIQTLYALVGA
jgi:CheY-like chemotaxis protein